MLALLQRCITIGLLLLAAAWAHYFTQRGSPVLAGAGALFIVFGYALFLAFEFALAWRINRADPAPRATVWQLVRAWWGEVVTTPLVFCWRQPFRSRAVADSALDATCRGRIGIVFVHGFVCNRGLWNPWLRRMQSARVPCIAVNLEPVFGSIDRYVATIDDAVARLAAATGRPPVIVAHSMGGLAVRAWMNHCGGDRRVQHVCTIGSPHRGTWLGRFGHAPNTRQMRLDARWLQELQAREPSTRNRLFTCYYSSCDNIVFPVSTATLPGADNRYVNGVGHVHLAFQPQLCDDVLRRVTAVHDAAAAGKEPRRSVPNEPVAGEHGAGVQR